MSNEIFVDRETLRLTRDGVWLSNGEEITHLETVLAFFRHLGHDDEGYFIQIGRDFKRIEVEDTAYFVRRADGDVQSGYELSLSDDQREPLDARTLAFRPEDCLTCRIVRGGRNEEARFLRSAYIDFLGSLQQDSLGYFVVLQGVRINL